jgi:hypothetical protein
MTAYTDLMKEVTSLIENGRKLEAAPVSIIYAPEAKYPYAVKRHCNKTFCTTAENAAKYFILYAGMEKANSAAQAAYNLWGEEAEASAEQAAEAAMDAHSLGVRDEPLTREEEADVRQCEADYAERPVVPAPAKDWYVKQPYVRTIPYLRRF